MQSLSYSYTSSRLSSSILNPFGMLMPSRSFSIQTKYRYGFNGKELDSDIGTDNYDFGARIYDARIGRWMAVDPLAKNYTSISCYAFVANCPMDLIDIDGEKIIICYIENGKKQRIEWKPGDPYSGSNEFVKECFNSLNTLTKQNAENAEILKKLSSTDVDIKIKKILATDANYVRWVKGTNTVRWDPKSGLEIMDKNNNKIGIQSPMIGLMHELGHAYLKRILTRKERVQILTKYKSEHEEFEQMTLRDVEEDYIVSTIEKRASIGANEVVRINYSLTGNIVKVKDSTSTVEVEKKKKHKKG